MHFYVGIVMIVCFMVDVQSGWMRPFLPGTFHVALYILFFGMPSGVPWWLVGFLACLGDIAVGVDVGWGALGILGVVGAVCMARFFLQTHRFVVFWGFGALSCAVPYLVTFWRSGDGWIWMQYLFCVLFFPLYVRLLKRIFHALPWDGKIMPAPKNKASLHKIWYK